MGKNDLRISLASGLTPSKIATRRTDTEMAKTSKTILITLLNFTEDCLQRNQEEQMTNIVLPQAPSVLRHTSNHIDGSTEAIR